METIRDLVNNFKSFGDFPAISWKEGTKTQKLSHSQLYEQVQKYSRGLLELGLEPGDRVSLLSKNIPQWSILSLGIDNAGLIDVPRGYYSHPEELSYILEHSEAKVAIVEDQEFLDRLKKHKHRKLHLIYTINKIKGEHHISELLEMGKSYKKPLPEIKKDTTVAIIYTSGTTGAPKGVELSHWNFMSNVNVLAERVKLTTEDKLLSILPAWHVFERIVKYTSLACGSETFYTTAQTLLSDFGEQKPTFMASVPRIWEMIYDKIMKKVKEKSKFERKIFEVSLKAVTGTSERSKFSPLNLISPICTNLLDKKVFSELREKLGGRFKYAISGGSSLQPYIDDFFDAAGIEILEGYGLTETSPVISVRIPGMKALHTVGPLLENIEGKIIDYETGKELGVGDKGVLYVKGPNVMKGYYRNYEETRKVLDRDGWFDTGDLAYFDSNSNLVICGREKDIIVLSNGKNVNPIPLETELCNSDYISTAVVTGQDWKRLGVMIVPDFEALKKYCLVNKVLFSEANVEECLEYSEIRELYREEIRKLVNTNKSFHTYEHIHEFILLPHEFTVGKELTATLKPKRSRIEEIYRDKIGRLQSVINGKQD
ncbi:long-chain fatty acid--CoA ligase [bacterium]|nr:long-chain fatty acid--CoA ligase [bacterium]